MMNESLVHWEREQLSFPIQDAESYNNKQAVTDMADVMNGYAWAESLDNS